MSQQSGRYDDVFDATFRPPKGGLASKYRATKAPPKREPEAESEVSFGWVDDVNVISGKSRQEQPSETPRNLGKSRRGELSNWNGLEATRRDQDYEYTQRIYDNDLVLKKPPSGNSRTPRDHPSGNSRTPRDHPSGHSGTPRDHPSGHSRTPRDHPSGHSRPPRDPNAMSRKPPMAPRSNPGNAQLHRDQVPSVGSDSRDESWAGWKTMALGRPGEGGESWGTLFGRMHLRWSGREQKKQAMPPGSLTMDDETEHRRTDFNSVRSDISDEERWKKPRHKRSRTYAVILACVVLLVVAVAVVIPTVILTRKSSKDDAVPDPFKVFDSEATSDMTYDPEMANQSSDIYFTTARDFCAGVEQRFINENREDEYSGCEVTELRAGSVVFVFRIITLVSVPDSAIKSIITGRPGTTGTFLIGTFVLQTQSFALKLVVTAPVLILNNVKCPLQPLQTFVGGSVSPSGNGFNDLATVTCNAGYVMQGSATITCTRRFKWETLPNCTQVTCNNYPVPGHSTTVPTTTSGHTYQTNITVTCNTGFEMNGNAVVSCMADGNWSASPTCSKITCVDYVLPDNSTTVPTTTSGHKYQTNITVTCDAGFEMSGDATVSCMADGNWSTSPTCTKITCVAYTVPDNSTTVPTTLSGHKYQTNITVTCDAGLAMNGSAVVSCMADGNWSASPTCIDVTCVDYTVPDNSTTVPTSTSGHKYQRNITVTCDAGFEINGNAVVSCMADGNWSASPTCINITCIDYTVPDNSTTVPAILSGHKFKTNITVTCNTGLAMNGNAVVSCMADGNWSTSPTCTDITCVDYTVPDNSTTVPTSISGHKYQTNITVTCDAGFEISGDATVSCMADGNWSASPTCTKITCVDYTVPDHSTTVPTSTSGHKYQTNITVTCAEGFEMSGDATVSCMADGNWSASPTCTEITCVDYTVPDHSTTVPTSTSGHKYQTNITVTCAAGFEMSGDATVSCMADGNWSASPTCTEITCVDYTVPDHSTTVPTSISGHKYQTNITVTCDAGFEISGDATVSCMADGNWSASPTCSKITCVDYTVPDNSTTVPTSTSGHKYQTNITVTCAAGFEISGDATVSCMADGNWSTSPTCSKITCVDYTVPDNSTTVPAPTSGHKYQTNITVTCDAGFEINGDATVSCMADGNWSASPTCTKITCVDYTVPDNSTTVPTTRSGHKYQSNITVTCDAGFEISGDATVSCMADGNWSASPTCTKITCVDYTVPDNSTTVPTTRSGHKYQSNITVTCDAGFEISGDATVSCMADGNWSTSPTCTKITCVDYTVPDNSTTVPTTRSGHKYQSNITVTCDAGFEISGDATVSCMADGNWSTSPTCKIKSCPMYTVPLNSQIKPDTPKLTYASSYMVDCNDGYYIEGDSNVTCLEDGAWSKLPTCKPVICNELAAPENGMTEPQNTANLTFNSTVKISCEDGYTVTGDDTVHCLSNKTWSPTPSCEPNKCDLFTYPMNSVEREMNIISDNSTKFAEELTVNCSDGYVLIGPKRFSCNTSGNWPNIECQEVECNTTGIEKPFLSVANVVNDVYTMECEEGYTLLGNDTVSCNLGNWTDIPECEIVSCETLEDPDNGTITSTSIKYGDTAVLTCDPGFDGSRQFECQADGTWSGTPSCAPVKCDQFELINGNVSSTSSSPFTFTNKITLTCQAGYEAQGTTMLTCTENGKWSDNTTCEPVVCGEVVDIPNGKVVPTLTKDLTFGESVSVECNTGYQVNGSSSIECQSSGSLSDIPTCDIVHCPSFEFPENAVVDDTTDTEFGTNVTIDCMAGYSSTGPSFSYCQADRTWTEPGECEAISCDELTLTGDVQTEDSATEITGKVFGDVVNLSCLNNKLLVGDQQISCNPNGAWEFDSNCVATDCDIDTFNKPENGMIIEANNTHLKIGCNDGYTISGDEVVTCDNAAWSASPNCTKVSCGELADPENGAINVQGVKYLDIATVTCNTGFKPKTSKYLQCLATGKWNDTGECELLDCGQPDLPDKAGDFTVSGTKYGTRQMNVSCIPGFQIENPVNITCTEQMEWTGIPSCSPIKCEDIDVPMDSTIVEGYEEDGYYYGDDVTIACDEGYELATDNDNQTVTCDTDGTWGEIEGCNKVDCGELNLPDKAGDVENTDTMFGAKVNVTCIDGYIINGDAAVECTSEGTWTTIPSCDAKSCGDYIIPENGDVLMDNGTLFTSTATFECDEGYTLEGNDAITCQADGMWTETPTCEVVDCEDIGPTPNGNYDGNLPTTFNQTIEIECDEGYEILGTNKTVCQSSGDWTAIPSCNPVDCETVDPPDNGNFVPDDIAGGTFGDVKNVSCQEGYELDGDEAITCTSSKVWTDVPSCNIVKCETFDGPDNSNIVEGDVDDTYFDGEVRLECIDGYEFEDESDGVVRCRADKSWTTVPACVKVECQVFEAPMNGGVADNSQSNQFEDVINIECDEGYTLTENGTLVCQANKEWSGAPECEIVICEDDPIIENGRIDATNAEHREYADETQILCDEGYEVEADSSVTCEANGSWSGIKNCTEVDCGEFTETIVNGTIANSTGTTYDQRVYIDCDAGYLLVGDNPISCLQSGSWQTPPHCDEIDCTDPNIAAGSYRKHNGTIYQVECDDGHKLIGSEFIECQVDGSWDEIPTCSEVICGEYTDELQNGEILERTGTRYEDTVTFACNEGFTLEGSESIMCDGNGDWEPTPFCNITDCGAPPVPEDGSLLDDTPTEFDTTLFAQCNPGFKLEGSDTLRCQASGNWSFDVLCVEIDCGNVTVNGVYKELTYSNGTKDGSVATVVCEEGHTTIGESTSICTENSEWSSILGCSLIEIAFESEEYSFTVGSPGRVICQLANADNWTSVLITDDMGVTLASINRTANGYEKSTSSEPFQLSDSSDFSSDAARVELDFTPVECDDDGLYLCGVIVGAFEDGNFNFGQTTLVVTDEVVREPTLVLPAVEVYNSTVNISCESLLGNNATDTSGLQLQAKLKTDMGFQTLEPASVNLTDAECNKRGVIEYSFRADDSWDGAEVKCVAGSREDVGVVVLPAVTCDDDPTVEFGDVTNTTVGDENVLTVACDEGYENTGDLTFECTVSGWVGEPNCTLIDCGLPVDADNAIYDVAVTSTTTFNSTISGHCETGYPPTQIFGDENFIVCGADGEWNSSYECVPVDCGNYTVPSTGSVVYSNGTTFGSVVAIECDDGYNLAGNASTAICDKFGFWSGSDGTLPACTVIGGLTVDPEEQTTTVGGAYTTTCTLLATPGWNRMGLFKSSEEGFVEVAIVKQVSDNVFENATSESVEILESSYFFSDNASLVVRVVNVSCSADGDYFCGAFKGDVNAEPTEDNSLTAETRVTISGEPDTPSMTVSSTDLQPNDVVTLTCSGNVGKTTTGENIAQLEIQILSADSSIFENITADIEPEVTQTGCLIEHTKSINVTVDVSYHGATVRCIAHHGSTLLPSDVEILNVTAVSQTAFQLQAIAEEDVYIAEYDDPESDEFKDFESDFCDSVTATYSASALNGQYRECKVDTITPGSIVVTFRVTFQDGASLLGVTVKEVLLGPDTGSRTVAIGQFVYTKATVYVLGRTTEDESGGSFSFGSSSPFTIGEPNSLEIAIQGVAGWSQSLSVTRTRAGTQTDVLTLTTGGATSEFAHIDVSDDSVLNEDGADATIEFEPVKCDDDGLYAYELELSDGSTKRVETEIITQYTASIKLIQPVQMREDRWTLNITCEATALTSENRELSWLLKRDGEADFSPFKPEDAVQKAVEFTNLTVTPADYSCLTEMKQYFDMDTTANQWNNTEIRCALDYGTDKEIVSNVGVFLIVPRSVCTGVSANKYVQNPLECRKKIQCTGDSAEWGYVFETTCLDGTCWVGPGDDDCEVVTTPAPPTTPVPGTPYIACSDPTRSAAVGTMVKYECELGNIAKVTTLNISRDDDEIYTNTDDENGISGALVIGEGVTADIDGDSMNVTVEAFCDSEGAYTVSINNGTEVNLTLALIADPGTPSLDVATVIYLNQRTELSCTGDVGRGEDGNAVAELEFEVQKRDSNTFEEIDEDIAVEINETDCVITATASASVYFGEEFNRSSIRCVARKGAEVVSESGEQSITLQAPSISFEESTVSSPIGEPFRLACTVDNTVDLDTLSLVKDGDMIATLNVDGTQSSEPSVAIVDSSLTSTQGSLKVDFASAECSDKGEYTCEAQTTNGDISSSKATVSITRGPNTPELEQSLQMIEGVAPWATHPTRCYGEVGYPPGSIALETDKDTGVFAAIDSADAVYTVDDDTCSTLGNITFYNTYTADWDNTNMRCVTRNSEIGDNTYEMPVTKPVNVIPDSFCDGEDDGYVVEHPYYCYGQLTCSNGVPLPLHLCQGDNTKCYDRIQRVCVNCETLNKCDVGSTPAPTLPPGTPVMNCTKEARNTKNAVASVTCDVTNVNITLSALATSNVIVTNSNDGSAIFDTSTSTPTSTSDAEVTYSADSVEATITPTSIRIDTTLTRCELSGEYTVKYNGEVTLMEETELVVTADADTPEYTQKPTASFYGGQTVTVECSGNVGAPTASAGTLSLMKQAPGTDTWVAQEGVTTDEVFDDETCGVIVTATYDVEVTAAIDGYKYACETSVPDGQTLTSTETVVAVAEPVLMFGDAKTTVAIGDALTVDCTWDTSIEDASANIVRLVDSDNEEAVLTYVHGGSVTAHVTGINGNFQAGDSTTPHGLSMSFDAVRCSDEAVYVCELVLDGEVISEIEKNITVTNSHGTPVLTLPPNLNLVIGKPTGFNTGHLQCSGTVSYPPKDSALQVEYYNKDAGSYVEFSGGTRVGDTIETEDCVSQATVSFRSITFESQWNDTRFRCAVYDDDDNLLESSPESTLLLIENDCSADNNDQYFFHPYDCHLYTQCYNNGTILVGTCGATCPDIEDNAYRSCSGDCDC